MSAPRETSIPPLGGAGVDRAAEERTTPHLLEDLRREPSSRVLLLHGDTAPIDGDRVRYVAPDEAPVDAEWAFLGRDPDGAALLTAVLPEGAENPRPDLSWASLRVVGGELGPTDAGVFVEALSLGRWLRDAPFCPACGARTELRTAGWSRSCPSCGREHFPRTDPAIIVAVTSAADPDRLLLGSNALWDANRYSCFAGFVEAGESLETAVIREVHEEAGVRVASVSYRSSQAWPYPRSLMLGFRAEAVDDDEARADGEEIASLRWFTREQIGAALARGGWGDGDAREEILLPGRASIAHRLIADWYAGTP